MGRSQRNYEKEYKEQAVKLAKEIGREGTGRCGRGGWKRDRAAVPPNEAMSLAEEMTALRQQMKVLERENRRLKEENEFLAEASAFFAASRRKFARNRE